MRAGQGHHLARRNQAFRPHNLDDAVATRRFRAVHLAHVRIDTHQTALALRLAPPVLVAVVTTYLGFHWITDTVAGLIAGLLLYRLLRRVPWDDLPLHRLPGTRRLAQRGWLGKVPDLALR